MIVWHSQNLGAYDKTILFCHDLHQSNPDSSYLFQTTAIAMTSHCSLGSELGKESHSEKVKEYGATLHPRPDLGNDRQPTKPFFRLRAPT